MSSTDLNTDTTAVYETTDQPAPSQVRPISQTVGRRRRRFDAGSFVAGLVFLTLGVGFALEAIGVWGFELSHLRFAGPVLLIIIGLSTLLGAATARRIEAPIDLR